MSGQRLVVVVVVVLVVLGLVALAVGVVYFVEPAKSLPSFIPGHIAHSTVHRNKRGIAGVVAGVILLGVALYAARREPPTPTASPPAPV